MVTIDPFALPPALARKAAPRLVSQDVLHFTAIADGLERARTELAQRLESTLARPVRAGQEAVERDQEVYRLTARLRMMNRYDLDLCLGRVVGVDGGVLYIGRLGLTDPDGEQVLVDWRSPAAEPFFAATLAHPMGVSSRRRYRWTRGRVTDYWDEVLADGEPPLPVAPDDESAFIASLGADRSPRMRDVLGTIQADQDAIIRAGSRGGLVVDGGPGAGKTVVAFHRVAYLLYSDARIKAHSGGVLVVGPSRPYLDYVSDVLPSLGEDQVRTCTLRDLVDEGAAAVAEPDPVVARLKAAADMVRAIDTAVRFYEEPPDVALTVETPWADVPLHPDDWRVAFESLAPGTPHNEGRDEVWEALLALLFARHGGDEPDEHVRAALARDEGLRTAFNRAWPIIEAADLVGDLWSVPAYLQLCAPWLSADDVTRLQRSDAQAWTVADLPLLDAARHRLGDPRASHRRRLQEAAEAAERLRMDQVIEEILQMPDEEGMLAQLRQPGLRDALVDVGALPFFEPDALAGPFAHVVVDEAQELTDAEWQMLLRRCPSRSFTIVGDRAQARHGFAESWQGRLDRAGLGTTTVATLSINYRTPAEIMAEAERVIRAALPDANVPVSVRAAHEPVEHGVPADLPGVIERWLASASEGTACVVGDPAFTATDRVASLTPELVKGLEFDLVVLVEPDRFGDGIEGAVDRYVTMTRATQRLVVLATRI